MKPRYCLVAVNSPFNNSILTYISANEQADISIGSIVKVPLGKTRTVLGCVLDISLTLFESKSESKSKSIKKHELKEIIEIVDSGFSFDKNELEFLQKVCRYYHYPLGQHVFDCFPKLLKRPMKFKYINGNGEDLDFNLNQDQERVRDNILKGLSRNDGAKKWLVHGITGSGKTSIYIQAINLKMSEGKSVLFLLPEINLTSQFVSTFTRHIKGKIIIYNSSINASAKFNIWREVASETGPFLIIGVRSSIFLPIKELGLIVVDEEHDQSFKQEDRCPYNARDVAIMKGRAFNIGVILGSATPAVESYFHFKENFPEGYLTLESRVGDSKLPDIVCLQDSVDYDNEIWPFNADSLLAIKQHIERKEQVLIFVNRLGFAHYIFCRACGHKFECRNCSSNLRYFKHKNELSCTYCDYKEVVPQICPECQNLKIYNRGFGTEKLKEVLSQNFPHYQIERFDRDEIKSHTSLEKRLDDFHKGEIDILVGTQMLSKGHNFEKVNLVLVLGLDAQLNYPDFRANERVYQLLTQVSGRSGRFGKQAQVILQSSIPDHKVFQYVKNKSFHEFYEDELKIRNLCLCPPFIKIAIVYISGKFKKTVMETALKGTEFLAEVGSTHFPSVEILGPRPSVIEKKVNKFTWTILLKSTEVNELHNLLRSFQLTMKFHHSISYKYDIDPYSIY